MSTEIEEDPVPSTDRELEALLKGSATVSDEQVRADPRIGALLAEIGRGIAERPRSAVLRVGRTRTVIAAAVAAALIVAVPVVIAQQREHKPGVAVTPTSTSTPTGPKLRTGRFEPTEDGPDRSEWLNLTSPELPAEIDRLGREFTLPPGLDWGFLKKPGLWRGQMQETELRFALATQARCRWMYYWRDNGRQERERARKALARSRSWSIYRIPVTNWATDIDPILRQLKQNKTRLLNEHIEVACDVTTYAGSP